MSGFTALASGLNNYYGPNDNLGFNANFWSSSESYTDNAWNRMLNYNLSDIYADECSYKNSAQSVRCIKNDSIQLALLTTSGISNITQSSANGGGEVIYEGGSFVTDRGLCYGLTQNPTISDFYISGGGGEGVFSILLDSLIANTTYYIRAYAVNGGGCAYGNQVSFKTSGIGEVPIVNTSQIISITQNSAISGGTVIAHGSTLVTQRGVCWSTTLNPTLADTYSTDGSGEGDFISYITGLNANTNYFIRAYATNSEGTAYGENKVFVTYHGNCPDIPTLVYEGKTYNTAQIGSQCWLKENLNVGVFISGSQNQSNNGITEKYCYENLESNCTAYGGLYQWNEMMQYTSTSEAQGICPEGWHIPSKPEWESLFNYLGGYLVAGGRMKEQGYSHWLPPNTGANNESGFSAFAGGQRNHWIGPFIGKGYSGYWWGSSLILGYGFVLKLDNNQENVYYYDTDKTDGNSVRCIKSIAPAISTAVISDITINSALGGGIISYGTGSPVFDRGICWSTLQNPTVLDFLTSDGSGFGSYISSLTSLNANTVYFVRAYAIRNEGVEYGNEVSFMTSSGIGMVPTISTSNVINITQNNALSGGIVSSEGSSAVTQYGVCWSTNQDPTIADNHTSDGAGTGAFISDISGLIPFTTYFVRAYALNVSGIGYGNQVNFITLPATLPVLSTIVADSITSTTASCGGNISFDGGAEVTSRGVCWSTSPNPTISLDHTNDGTGTGSFSSSLVGLAPLTTYYFRAYATNIIGTVYGNELSFTTTQFDIGQGFGGGIIFYIDASGQHGLIAAAFDQGMAQWGCYESTISGTSTAIGWGQSNTTAITNGCSTAGIAARICSDLLLNGFDDWFLPSKDELNQLYLQKDIIGGFVDDYYWSSSEDSGYMSDYAAWLQFFPNGYQEAFSNKNYSYYVRAVRTF